MHKAFIEKILQLDNAHQAYATALIVRRKNPSSGKPGDKAIITADGELFGWIGGGCTRGIVMKEALLALQDRKPRFVTISPYAKESSFAHTKIYTMTCQSGGEVEVYIEPVLPKPKIILFGSSHIAMALSRIARAIDYRVEVVMTKVDKVVFPEANKITEVKAFTIDEAAKNAYVVVCTQGEGDLEALEKALAIKSNYISFVASRKKANAIYNELRQKGVGFDELKLIKTPAGIDIGAKTPEEVAISILAQIIQDFRMAEEALAGKQNKTSIPNEDYYLNPVCNIPVQKATARHVLDYEGKKVYFCCDGCKVSFEKNPAQYMTV